MTEEEIEVLALLERAVQIAINEGSRTFRDVKVVTGFTDAGVPVTAILVNDKPFEIKVERVK